MNGVYQIFGAEMSPYSVKVRAYARYKRLPHLWLSRGGEQGAQFTRHAKVPLVPLVVTPEDIGIQDSTPIIEALEAVHSEPSIHPQDPALSFISALIEELGDEWGNKWMFHYRWRREIDQRACSSRLALALKPGMNEAEQNAMAEQARTRMVSRVWFVGSSDANTPLIESSFQQALAQLDTHLATRPYLFGARPAFADFGLWGQIYEMWTDPTAGALIEARAQHVLAWIHRMAWPNGYGPFEGWDTLEATLLPIVRDWAGELFLPWSLANAAAVASNEEEFSVVLRGTEWRQKPQKYHARSLEALRKKYASVNDQKMLDAILAKAGIGVGTF